MNTQNIFVVLLVVLATLVVDYTEACSCMPVHPQDQYCQSDFVILARIRKEILTDNHKIYKAKIRKEFKMSEKARLALKSGRIQTALDGAMCGVYLEPGKLYLITGRVMGLQAHVSLCGYSRLWKEVMPRQRKGFRLLYGKGCSCKISYYLHVPTLKDRCIWNNFACQSDHGICLRSPSGQCHWSKSLDLRKCIKGDFKPEVKTTSKTTEPFQPKEENPEPLRGKSPEPMKDKPGYYRDNHNRINYNHYRLIREVVKTS